MKINVNGISLNYEKYGSGAPLIMLHGNGETHEIFDKAIPLLSERFTVYAIDTRGHGESEKVGVYHYDDMKNDLRCFIETLGLERPALMGFSDGAIIGLLLACEYPDMLSALIACGANSSPEGVRDGWMRFFRFLSRRVHDPRIDMMLCEPSITAEMLHQIKIPTLIAAGSHDLVKRSDTEFIAKNINNSTMRILRFQGHGSYIVHKERIARLILDFLPQ